MAEPAPRSGGRTARALGPVAALGTRRPRLVAAVWLVAMCGLAFFGKELEQKVSTHPIYVDGSDVQREHALVVREFGGEDTMVVMLRGPRAAVERQGRALATRLDALPRTLAISPWDSAGTIRGLRPRPGVAAILVSVGQSSGREGDVVPMVRRQVREVVSAPVRASLAGGPAIVDSLRESIQRAVGVGEKLALPVLLIVLLLVCRSLLAAAMPVLIGGLVVGATRGILDLLSGAVLIDSIALGAAGMLGLALGVDYSLLVVSRFREEIGRGATVERAAQTTVLAAGRSIVPAGCGLVLAMLVSLQLIPGSFVASVALAVIAASILSVLSAIFLAPALLTMLGSRIDRWSLPRRRRQGSLALAWSSRLSRSPAVVLGLILLLMLSGAWAFTLNTRTGSIAQLPADDPGRLQQEAIERALGPGWVAPLEVAMDGGGKPVTTAHRLDALASFQRRVEADPGVIAMAGFAGIERSTDQLGQAESTLASSQRGLQRLGGGLARAQDGAAATATGFQRAAAGAGQLGSALREADGGSAQLARGLQKSGGGAARLSSGLGRASAGGGRLSHATAEASSGAARLAASVERAREQAGEAVSGARLLNQALRSGDESLAAVQPPLGAAEARLADAWAALQAMTSGRSDPQYEAAANAVAEATRQLTGAEPGGEGGEGIAAGVEDARGQFGLGLYLAEVQARRGEQTREGVERLARNSARLDRGLSRLSASSRELSGGLEQLSAGSDGLAPGLQQLGGGAELLRGGLGRLADGAGQLAGGLDSGAQQSRRLAFGLGRMRNGVGGQDSGAQLRRLRRNSPGLFDSGYFYLAGLDGTAPHRRDQAGLLVNLDGGGSAARMLVIPRHGPSSDAAEATTERVRADAERLEREAGAEVLVGGWGPSLVDIDSALRARGPIARIALSLVTILILLLVTRSLALGLIAALLNLLTVSATFGLLSLLFDGSLLGGPGFVDSSIIAASVILVFGLAIDYEVFVFARIREEYLRTGSTAEAIDSGLAQTAHVITGAAIIMLAVFLAFSVSPLASMRNLGVGLAIATAIDAMIVRFVLVPAAMRALGDRSWWLPRWLDRLLPGRSTLAPKEAT